MADMALGARVTTRASSSPSRELPPVWPIPRLWEGETAFIIGGGPSVATQNLDLLRGRRVMVINSSYQAAPWADFLIFSDGRWWDEHRERVGVFQGRILSVSQSSYGDRLLRLNRRKPPGLADAPDTVVVNFTTLTAAINAVVHLGAKAIVLLGADGKVASDGRTHHHAPHPWRQLAGCWEKQKEDLLSLVGPLRARGITVVNASPGSAWADLWPIVRLEETL